MGKININRIIKDIDPMNPSSWEKTVIKNINHYNKDESLSKIKDAATLELKYPTKNYLEQYFPFIGFISALCLPIIIMLRDFVDKQNEWIEKILGTMDKEQTKHMIHNTSENYKAVFELTFVFLAFIFVLFIAVMFSNKLYDGYIVKRKKRLTILISVIDNKVNDNEFTKGDTEFKSYTIRIKEIE